METTCREAWHVLRRNPLPRQKNLKPLQRCSWSCGKFSSFKCWRSLWHFSGMWACGIRRLTVKNILCKNSRISFIIKDPQQREHWRTGSNRKLIFSLFQCADSANSYSISQNKAFIRCVRQKCFIKRDLILPVASYDVHDVSVLVAHSRLLGVHPVNRAFLLLARIQTDSAWIE